MCRVICHCYLLLALTLQEIVPEFQEEETKIQLDMALILPAKDSIVYLSPFLARWQQTELYTNSTHVWYLADGKERNPTEKNELKRAPLYEKNKFLILYSFPFITFLVFSFVSLFKAISL